MTPVDPSNTDASWLRTPLTDATEIAARYDEWVPTYEHELVKEWRYDAPGVAAQMIAEALKAKDSASVLDLGCGTGLVGKALHNSGIRTIDGVDVSEASLDAARQTGIYRNTIRHDFNSGPLPFLAHTYDAAISVGVLSYAHDPISVIRDLCRVVVPAGIVVFTHRIDLWDRQAIDAGLEAMRDDAEVRAVTWSDPMPYMPGNPSEGDLQIRYVTITTAES